MAVVLSMNLRNFQNERLKGLDVHMFRILVNVSLECRS